MTDTTAQDREALREYWIQRMRERYIGFTGGPPRLRKKAEDLGAEFDAALAGLLANARAEGRAEECEAAAELIGPLVHVAQAAEFEERAASEDYAYVPSLSVRLAAQFRDRAAAIRQETR